MLYITKLGLLRIYTDLHIQMLFLPLHVTKSYALKEADKIGRALITCVSW